MPDDPNSKEALTAKQTVQSASIIYGQTIKLVGSFAGLSGIAYLIGWQKERSYYTVLGAKWVPSLLTSQQIMLELRILPNVISDSGRT